MNDALDGRITELVGRARSRPWRAVVGWLTLVAIAWAGAIAAGGSPSDALTVPGSGSDRAERLVRESSVAGVGGIDAVAVFHVERGRVDEQRRADAIDTALIEVSHLKGMSEYDRPFVDDQVSADGTTAFAQIRSGFGEPMGEARYRRLLRLDAELAPVGVDVSLGGVLPDLVADPSPAALEFVGVTLALVVLSRALGSFRTAMWPIVSAAIAVAAALGGIALLSTYVDMPSYAAQLAAMIGLGVGIDDGLLLIARWSAAPDASADATASRRAGRAVLLAAGTVVVSLIGLAVPGIPFFTAMGVATAVAVVAVASASFTLLPALLVLDRRGVPSDVWVSRPSPRQERLMRRLCRRPLFGLAAGLALILLLAAPALRLDLGNLDAGSAAPGESRRVAHDLLTEKFGPGYAAPFTVVLNHEDGLAWERGPTTDRAVAAVARVAGVARVLPIVWGNEGVQAAFRVVPTSPADAPGRTRLLADLRSAVGGVVRGTGSHGGVGGDAATRLDVAERVEHRLGWMIATVAGLSLVLLVAAWRTPVLALKAAVLNGLSVGAAYGVLVAVFQWGWGAGLIGLDQPVPIDPIVPVFLFAILFGLSMDYEVFLIAAVRDRRAAGRPDTDAIVEGIAGTWRVVGVAALIMVSVFVGFVADPDPVSKMFGVGLAAAVAVDATVARGLLVPATLALLGRWNWWVPGRTRRAAGATSAPRPGTVPSA